MTTPSKRLSLLSSSSYTSTKSFDFNDLLQRFYTIVENLKQNHENDMQILHQRIDELENENKRLRTIHEQHPHSIFDIDYVANDSHDIDKLKIDLEQANKKINALQVQVDQQAIEYGDIKGKYELQLQMNEGRFEQQHSSTNDLNKIKDFEFKFQQIKEQLNQFEQCNYESDEQIRLLKQILFDNDYEQQMKTITQSLTVKQSDLFQQTDIVENILNKQQDKIIEKIQQLFEKNTQTTTTKNKKPKKKRL